MLRSREERYEVDFLVRTKLGELKLLQVVYDPGDPKTLDREMRALEKAEQALGIKGELITVDSYIRNFPTGDLSSSPETQYSGYK